MGAKVVVLAVECLPSMQEMLWARFPVLYKLGVVEHI